ncbi:unnamed protein product [Musa hybrid cultivar]
MLPINAGNCYITRIKKREGKREQDHQIKRGIHRAQEEPVRSASWLGLSPHHLIFPLLRKYQRGGKTLSYNKIMLSSNPEEKGLARRNASINSIKSTKRSQQKQIRRQIREPKRGQNRKRREYRAEAAQREMGIRLVVST